MLFGHENRELRERCRRRVITNDEASDGGVLTLSLEKGTLCGESFVTVTLGEFSVALAWGSEGVPPSSPGELPDTLNLRLICPQLPKAKARL